MIKRVNQLDFRIRDSEGKESVVHQNRLKLANDASVWKEKNKPTRPKPHVRKMPESGADENALPIRSRKIFVPTPRLGRAGTTPSSPVNMQRHVPDTPEAGDETPLHLRVDRDYSPPTSPRSRNELRPSRPEPPITRARTRLQSDNRAE